MLTKDYFSGKLLITDLDGSVLPYMQPIPKRNLEAIRIFTEHGGKFTIATGRSIESAGRFVSELGLTLPAILYNGSSIYDYQKNEFLWLGKLDDEVENIVKLILDRFPTAGIEVYNGRDLHILRSNIFVEKHVEVEILDAAVSSFQKAKRPWQKVLITDDAETLQEIIAFTGSLPHDRLGFVLSSVFYYEIIPKHGSKGATMLRLAEMLGIKQENIIALGDYENDLEMLEMAGLGCAPQNAIEKAKAIAGRIVCDCQEGALADVVEFLADGKIKI